MIRNIIIFLGLFSYCYGQQNNAQKITIKEGFGLDGVIVIGETKKEVKKKHGKSDPFLFTKYRKMAVTHPYNKRSARTVTIQKVGRPSNTYYYSKLELYMSFGEDNRVNTIYFTSEKYQTSKGLSVGDSREKAYRLYREGDSPILQNPSEGIDIVFDCDVVKEIRLYKSY